MSATATETKKVTALPKDSYACTGSTQFDGRCRKESGHCPDHTKGLPLAPMPDIVILKIAIPDELVVKLLNAGVRQGIWVYDPELEVEREANAERMGRNPHAIRTERADDGSPVFGKNGIGNASIAGLMNELRTGYELANFAIQGQNRVVMAFSRDGGRNFPFGAVATMVGHLNTHIFRVDVWANPRNDNGKVVHTVNTRGPGERGTNPLQIAFDNGNWCLVF